MILKFVTKSLPLSPLFPFVSSMESKQSMRTSPGLVFICCEDTSKRTSRSSHNTSSTDMVTLLSLLWTPLQFRVLSVLSTLILVK